MYARRISIALVIILCCDSLPAQSPPEPTAHPVTERAAEALRTFMARQRIPGLSIAVGYRGELVWTEAFGVADVETATVVTPSSVFPLGSTSKTFTSLALGVLLDEKKIDLDVPIQTYVPYFPKKPHPITARQLAGHLAALRDYDMAKGEYNNMRQFASVQQAVAIFSDDPLLFEPGTKYVYSAYNFVLLSAAIEGASRKDFLSFVEERIVTPLALERTRPFRVEQPPRDMVTTYVAGFMGMPTKATPVNVSNKWAAGGFVSTPSDMVRLGNALLAGEVVKQATFCLLTTPQMLKDGTQSPDSYALGWRSGWWKPAAGRKDLRVVHHGGTANGAMSFFLIVPEAELVVSLQSNLLFQPFSSFSQQAFAIAAMFLAADHDI